MYVLQSDEPYSVRDPAAALPDWHELLAACCGHIGDRPDDHPVTRWARALAELHLIRRDDPLRAAELDGRRSDLVRRIDEWVCDYIGRRPAKVSLGAVIDGMAAAQVRATQLLRSAHDAADEQVYAAWSLLASLADGWGGLVDTVTGPVGAPTRAALSGRPPVVERR